ncbi:hypothetical protein PCE1_002150 [Barthelona sp. PCE]
MLSYIDIFDACVYVIFNIVFTTALGYVGKRRGIIKSTIDLSNMLFMLTLPCQIFTQEVLSNTLKFTNVVFITAFALFHIGCGLFLGLLFTRRMKHFMNLRSVLVSSSIFTNSFFLPSSVLTALASSAHFKSDDLSDGLSAVGVYNFTMNASLYLGGIKFISDCASHSQSRCPETEYLENKKHPFQHFRRISWNPHRASSLPMFENCSDCDMDDSIDTESDVDSVVSDVFVIGNTYGRCESASCIIHTEPGKTVTPSRHITFSTEFNHEFTTDSESESDFQGVFIVDDLPPVAPPSIAEPAMPVLQNNTFLQGPLSSDVHSGLSSSASTESVHAEYLAPESTVFKRFRSPPMVAIVFGFVISVITPLKKALLAGRWYSTLYSTIKSVGNITLPLGSCFYTSTHITNNNSFTFFVFQSNWLEMVSYRITPDRKDGYTFRKCYANIQRPYYHLSMFTDKER